MEEWVGWRKGLAIFKLLVQVVQNAMLEACPWSRNHPTKSPTTERSIKYFFQSFERLDGVNRFWFQLVEVIQVLKHGTIMFISMCVPVSGACDSNL